MAEPQDTLAIVNKVGAHTEIASVQLVKVRAEARVRPESIVGQPGKYFIEQRVSHTLAQDRLEVFVAYTVTVKKTDDAAKDWLLIAPTFRVLYRVTNASELAPEHVERFASFNAIFNTWPYLRELLQNTTDRMGFPPLTIHLYRINVSSQSTKPPSEAGGEKREG